MTFIPGREDEENDERKGAGDCHVEQTLLSPLIPLSGLVERERETEDHGNFAGAGSFFNVN